MPQQDRPRLLVTGATGFVGTHLLDSLSAGWDVVAIHRGEAPPSRVGVTWVRRDLSDPRFDVDGLPPVEGIVHLAQSGRFRDFPGGAQDVFDVNLTATARLAEWGHRTGARRLLVASTGGYLEAGCGDGPIAVPGPLTHYFATKRAAELIAQSWTGRLVVVVLRLFFVYGPGQRPAMLIPRLVRQIAAGEEVTLQGADGVRLNPLHVADAARAFATAARLEESARISLAGSELLTLREVCELIGRRVGAAPRLRVFDEAPPGHLVGDTSAMQRLLGPASVSFAEGIGEVCRGLGLAR